MKYNGNFVDLMNGNIFEGSAIDDGPGNSLTKKRNGELSKKYDISWVNFENKLKDLLAIGHQQDLEVLCANEYVPNPLLKDVHDDD